MKLLVTGGAGFIGSNFVSYVLRQSRHARITVLDSLTYAGNPSRLELSNPRLNFINGNICDKEHVSELVSSCDVVVHFAAETHNDYSLQSPDLFFETNVMGTLSIANACVKSNKRLHHVSTDEVFGDLPLKSPASFSLTTAYSPSSPYSASKASSDHIIRAWTRSFGLRATISNCSNNFGPHQSDEKLIPATIKRILSGENPKLYGDGKNVRDWIHVEDHVRGIWRVLESGKIGETYLFGARDRVTNLSIVQMLLTAAGRGKQEIDFVADRPGHDKKYSLDPSVAEKVLNWTPRRPKVLESGDYLLSLYS